jgi:hypothetical protein
MYKNDVTLDPNHNYFLLIDDQSCSSLTFAQTGTYAAEILERHKLELDLKKNNFGKHISPQLDENESFIDETTENLSNFECSGIYFQI